MPASSERARHLIERKEKRPGQLQANFLSLAAEERAVNHHQRKILHAIFAHPVNANLRLEGRAGHAYGARGRDGRQDKEPYPDHAQRQTTILHLTQHSLLKAEVMQIRKFLESSGISAGAYPA